MDDYIKREDALDIVAHNNVTGEITLNRYDKIIDGIYEIPSANVAPVKHGRWMHERLPSTSGGSYAVVRCSLCEYQYPMAETRYCPNCGAEMDEEEDIR